ncbi:MobF family relaxase [Pantoea agglomerans]|jgi:conjugative relaxase-like TrwC/TraI family protein|uniref:Conjugative relaxase n=2 Tax=Enterobacter agglomerans TaxID=549 RepID=A0A7X2MIH5_ENTAG|nr:MobF family relaxase [Pantoea agglomerans]MSE13735.1 conjugative relaxase [Pantoea agglomerans]
MMTVAPVGSAADAAGYYSSKDNYYFLDDMPTQWMGEGARELGLEGPVDLDTFTGILHGNLPNGVTLGKEMQGAHVHRPGHDFTFSAPKSVSMLILAGGDKRLLEAHHDALKETLAIMEQTISARDTKEGITHIVTSGKMVTALFTHDTSRNLDPQVHTHAVVANVTELDGKWKALATDTIHGAGFIETAYRNQITYGKIYRNVLKGKAEAIGYETVPTGGRHDLWEIKGFTETVLEEFSSRHREIHARAGEDASLKSRDVAALDTRQRKQDISRYGEDEPAPVRTRPDPSSLNVTSEPAMERAVTAAKNSPGISGKASSNTAIREQDEPITTPVPVPERSETAAEKPPVIVEEPSLVPPVRELDAPIEKPETADGRTRLQDRWQRQMDDVGFDIGSVISEAKAREAMLPAQEETIPALTQAMDAVRIAISVLSDNRTRFTYGDLLLTAHEAGETQQKLPDLRRAIDQAIGEDLLTPLDGEKGVFTSHIHLLDELSVQSLTADILKENKVANLRIFSKAPPAHLEKAALAPVSILNAPASVQRLRETTEELVTMSREQGRDVKVLTSSAERALSFGKSPLIKNDLLSRSRVLDSTFSLGIQSTLIIEGAEKLGLKEMLVLTGEAREKNAQLIFLDSAGRQSNANALSVLASAGVERLTLSTPAPEMATRVLSIQDKRERYQVLADRYAELSGGDAPVTAVVTGAREQQQLTGVIRDALQNAGKLGRNAVNVEARTPVFATAKERRLPATYRSGMVLEDRSGKEETRHYVIDRVHEDTRMLSLTDSDGVLTRVKMADLNGDWRLFTRTTLSVAQGEQLFALAADKEAGLKARDRLTVTSVENGMLTIQQEGQKRPLRLSADNPLYVTHGYVSAPGSRDHEAGTVLASLGARDLSANMMNALAQSGNQAEIYTGEALSRAEEKLGRLQGNRTPLELVRQLSGREEAGEAMDSLKSGVQTDAQKAVSRAVANMRDVAFPFAQLTEKATEFLGSTRGVIGEITRLEDAGELIKVPYDGEARYVARATWEMEKAIIREVEAGKNTLTPLMESALAVLPSSLTVGQRDASALILQSADRFTAVQGYAGVGKTTQFNAVKTAIDTLPETVRPIVIGLGPTHRAVKEMRSIGIEGQTMKSFLLDWQQRTAAGEKVSYGNTLFLIDEASMLGNQDTAEAMRAIAAGNGRAVMVGDVAQLESPESGAPFRLLQERSPIDVAVMKEIKRQLSDDLRGAVYSVIENKAAAALEKIDRVSPAVVSRQAGSQTPVRSVVEIPPPPKDENGNELPGPDGKRAPRVHDAIVADYMSRTPSARAETLIVVSLNDDRRAINAGIHQAMTEAKELGGKAVQVPVLERVSGGRHDFNKFDAWRVGHVVLSGERYLNVIGLDRGTNNVLLRDEDGRMRYYSPAELNATEIEVFRKETLELRTGDSIRMNKTQRQAGHAAHEQYRVAALHDNGDVVLQGTSGKKVISPGDTLADRHIDYAWAVTGHGAQGASSRFVIALESATGRRGMISGMRSFYISLSRAKEHVQVYSDNVKLWKEALIREEKGFKTAHDALSPEIERKQARAIWSMGQPLAKTAIGRAFLNSHALRGWPVTARIIPPTRKYPEPHLALPAYDGNGKAAGLTLIPLRHEKGTLNPGQPRQLATDSAQAALLQKSRNGETVIVSDLAQGLIVARDRPEAGVVILTGRQQPSAQLLRVAGGHAEQAMRPDATLLSLVKAELQDMLKMLPLNEPAQDERETLRTALEAIKDSLVLPEVHREEKGERALDSAEIRKTAQLLSELPVIKLPETSREGMDKNTLPAELAERIAEAMQHKLSVLPAETAPDYTSLVRQASEELAQAGDMPPDSAVRAVLNALSGSRLPSGITSQGEMPAGGSLPASVVRHVQDELAAIQVTGKHMHETISEREVASVARELDRQVQVTLPPEVRGREPERELPSPEITRHIQKER